MYVTGVLKMCSRFGEIRFLLLQSAGVGLFGAL
jgi:hypothetical protein